MQQLNAFTQLSAKCHPNYLLCTSTTPSSRLSPRRRLKGPSKSRALNPPETHLRRLTSRIVHLTRRRQLHQVFGEIDHAKKQYGSKLNTIVMNAVVEACIQCGDVDSALRIFQEMSGPDGCGVDGISYATILKGLGEARRIDEAFQMLEYVEQGTAPGCPKLSPTLIYGLLNALLEAGDIRRANGLLARYRSALHEGGPSILLYNLLIKGYTNTDCPMDALNAYDEILLPGLKHDRLTYNTLLFACIKSGEVAAALQLFEEMKVSRNYLKGKGPFRFLRFFFGT